MVVSFYYKYETSGPRHLPIIEAWKSDTSHVSGLLMEQITGGDPSKDKLITLWTGDPECPVRTLHRGKREPTVPTQDVAKIAKRHLQVIATRAH